MDPNVTWDDIAKKVKQEKYGALFRSTRGDSGFKNQLPAHLEQEANNSLFSLAFRSAQGVFDEHQSQGKKLPQMMIWLSDGKSPKYKDWPTDPGHRLILATILLYDLAQPNPTLGDTFEIIPFDEGKEWKWSQASGFPKSQRPAIKVAPGQNREDLVKAIDSLQYNGEMTYYYPGMLRAIEDLKAIKSGANDIKTVVLFTDGLPEPDSRDQEIKLIREQLIPLMTQHQIRLYILAFSIEAFNNRSFLESMITAGDGLSHLGEVLVDQAGTSLLFNMIRLFSYNYGFIAEDPQNLPVNSLDLNGGITPPRVAVVVQSNQEDSKAPDLSLKPPPSGKLNVQSGVLSASVKAGGYSLQWVLSPDKGNYEFTTDVTTGSVAVLRDSPVLMEVKSPSPYTTKVDQALAGTDLRFQVQVRSGTGAAGDPCEVELSYIPTGEGFADPLGKRAAPVPGSMAITQLGAKQVQTGSAQQGIEFEIPHFVSEAWLVVAADGPISGLMAAQGNPGAKSINLNHGSGQTEGLDRQTRGYHIARLQNPSSGKWQFSVPGLTDKAAWMLLQDSSVSVRFITPPVLAK